MSPKPPMTSGCVENSWNSKFWVNYPFRLGIHCEVLRILFNSPTPSGLHGKRRTKGKLRCIDQTRRAACAQPSSHSTSESFQLCSLLFFLHSKSTSFTLLTLININTQKYWQCGVKKEKRGLESYEPPFVVIHPQSGPYLWVFNDLRSMS